MAIAFISSQCFVLGGWHEFVTVFLSDAPLFYEYSAVRMSQDCQSVACPLRVSQNV